jgi:hypothetical protein
MKLPVNLVASQKPMRDTVGATFEISDNPIGAARKRGGMNIACQMMPSPWAFPQLGAAPLAAPFLCCRESRMPLSAEQRHVLTMLSTAGSDGVAQALLSAASKQA